LFSIFSVDKIDTFMVRGNGMRYRRNPYSSGYSAGRVLKKLSGFILILVLAILTGAAIGQKQVVTNSGTTLKPLKTGYVPVNGVKMYYEIYGTGKRLVLIHGGLGEIEMFGQLISQLAAEREVFAIDLQGHGRTADINRPLSYEAMADDVAKLIWSFGLGSVDVMGYSLGAGVALQLTIRHPETVLRLVSVSFPARRDGWFHSVLSNEARLNKSTAEMMKQSLVYAMYAKLAPRPGDWTALVGKTGDLLKRDYDWSDAIRQIACPVLLVYADADAVRPQAMLDFFGLLGGGMAPANWDGSGRPVSQLSILPGLSHYSICSSPALGSVVLPFLEKPLPAPPVDEKN